MKKISLFFVFLMMSALSFTAAADNLRGDCNQDGGVTIDDVTALIDYLLNEDASGISLAGADSNQNGTVTIDDVTSLIDYLLNGVWIETEVIYVYVDLGLPSGTLWATCNVGASSPEEYGDYFAWGETEPKDVYDWTTYKWGDGFYFSKYNSSPNNGTYMGVVDYKTELDLEDDAAYVNKGWSWRTPTIDQILELYESCSWQWTERHGVKGQLLTGPNGQTMFLPAAGSRYGSSLNEEGVYGSYLSCSNYTYLYFPAPDEVTILWFNSAGFDDGRFGFGGGREWGYPVRAVYVSNK